MFLLLFIIIMNYKVSVSSYPQTSRDSPVIISMDNYYRLLKFAFDNSYMKVLLLLLIINLFYLFYYLLFIIKTKDLKNAQKILFLLS